MDSRGQSGTRQDKHYTSLTRCTWSGSGWFEGLIKSCSSASPGASSVSLSSLSSLSSMSATTRVSSLSVALSYSNPLESLSLRHGEVGSSAADLPTLEEFFKKLNN